MPNEFTAIMEQDGEWFIAYSQKSQVLTARVAPSRSAGPVWRRPLG